MEVSGGSNLTIEYTMFGYNVENQNILSNYKKREHDYQIVIDKYGIGCQSL